MDARSKVIKAVEGLEGDLVSFASDLVAIPTENPPGTAYPECVGLIERRLREFGLPVELVNLAPDRTAVISGVGTGPTLRLHGHYDVVPASGPGQFAPRLQGGRLWGRGSADMKGAIASMAIALVGLSALDLAGRVEMVLVPDEETGGQGGSGLLSDAGRLGRNAIGAVLGEPTSGRIWNAHRGAVTLRVTVTGRPAHVGLHYEGANAFDGAMPIIDALRALRTEIEDRRTAFRITPEAARHSILMLGGEVTGGHQYNVVPARFSFTVERRFNPEEDLETERARLLGVIRDATPAGVRADVEIIQEAASSAVAEDADLVRSLRASVEEVTGRGVACEMCPGLLENRYYAAAGVPAVAYGPGALDVSHGPEESVEVERLLECAKIYALTAIDLVNGEAAPPQ